MKEANVRESREHNIEVHDTCAYCHFWRRCEILADLYGPDWKCDSGFTPMKEEQK